MTIPAIDELPPAPSLTDPTNFATVADTFVAALPPLVVQFNTSIDAINAAAEQVSADATSTGNDAVATAADRTQTGLDKTACDNDAAATAADRVAVAADMATTEGYKDAASASATTAAAFVGNQGRNRLINGDFRIKQRAYASGGTLASGACGHDRWKAGAAGGDYTFVQKKSDTQITISAGKTLMQTVEDVNVEGGGYVLSWAGTAQGRIGVSGAAPSGAYAASPIVVAAADAGETVTVEFNAGTLGLVQLEPGNIATPFERVDFSLMFERCRRHCRTIGDPASINTMIGIGHSVGDNEVSFGILFPGMYSAPTVTIKNVGNIYLYNADHSGVYACNNASVAGVAGDSCRISLTTVVGSVSGLDAGQAVDIISNILPAGYILLEAEI